MRMRRIGFFLAVLCAPAAVVMSPYPSHAGGLSTQLGEVAIENLQIGQTYNLKQLANLSLIVTNTSDFSVELVMEVQAPDSSELKGGSEPVPATGWITLTQTTFTLERGAKATSDILITVPDDERYLGRKYQASIWSHTLGGNDGGMCLAYGLKTRVLFSTDTVKADPVEAVVASTASADFTLKPEEITLTGIEPGRVYDVAEAAGVLLEITNRSEHIETIRLASRTVDNSLATLTGGFSDAPDASFLRFSESEITLPPRATRIVKMYLEFPARTEYAGGRYMFVIHAYTAGESVIAGVYSRLYASTK
ncbi:MAG: hypothetical protein AB1792_00340 [Candidatus Zixiibacteriota bacterium]